MSNYHRRQLVFIVVECWGQIVAPPTSGVTNLHAPIDSTMFLTEFVTVIILVILPVNRVCITVT